MSLGRFFTILSTCGVVLIASNAFGMDDSQLEFLYSRVTGLQPQASDAEALHGLGTQGVYAKLFADSKFVENRLATFASTFSNEEAEPFEDVDDFQVSIILAIVNNIDIRDLLTKPYFIESVDSPGVPVAPRGNAFGLGVQVRTLSELPSHYRLNFKDIAKGPPANGVYVEGLLTTRGFAMRSIQNGTNRRAVRAIYDQFLCSKIDTWKDATLDDFYVGRDVDRKPGDNPETYQNVCRGCHAPMDAQRGAFAHYDYDKNMDSMTIDEGVVQKYLQNSSVYPEGVYVTTDASWENLLTDPAAQARFGWRGGPAAMKGKGVLSFASMIANAHQFQTCMAQRMVQIFCEKSDLRPILESAEFKKIADGFRDDGYRMKNLIENVVGSSLCH
jgi:hypothetical protein